LIVIIIMEILLVASLYDKRWLLFGWPSRLGLFDIQKAVSTSTLFFILSYLLLQFTFFGVANRDTSMFTNLFITQNKI